MYSINSLLKNEGFDKNENVFFVEIDSSSKTLAYNIKSTDSKLADKAFKLAVDNRLNSAIFLLPSPKNKKVYGIVNTSIANTRAGTSRAKSMATQVLMGMKLEIIDNEGKWYRVRTPQGYVGWLVKSSFEIINKSDGKLISAKNKGIIITPTTFCYRDENREVIVSDLVYGDVVELVEGKSKSNFVKIILPGNRSAVVSVKDIMNLEHWQKTVSFSKEKVLEMANYNIGQPYLWGGNSFKGNDCSGLSASIYFGMGMLLPRDAYQQQKVGDRVDYKMGGVDGFKNLQIGDLVFFGESKKASHVAVWIGNNEYIHNSSTYGRAYISSVDSTKENYHTKWLSENIIEVKRINGSDNNKGIVDLKSIDVWL